MKLPDLFGKASSGKIKLWRGEVVDNGDGTASIFVDHGMEGGKLQTDEKLITEGKNIGKANETTPYEQAVSELRSDWNKKIDQGYVEDKTAIADYSEAEKWLPMLAKVWEDAKQHVKWPGVVQRKLDGCLHRDSIVEFDTGERLTIGYVVDNRVIGNIKSLNIETGEIEFKPILNHMKNLLDINEDKFQWYEIELEAGNILLLTGNHRVWLPELACYRRVDELDGTESLLTE